MSDHEPHEHGGPWALAFSPCFGCGRVFGYNPHRVPSIPIGPDGQVSASGDRKPICRNCVTLVNPMREEHGLDPIVIYPDSYEPIEGIL